MMINSSANQADSIEFEEFAFEVVTINVFGEVTNRQTHTARQFMEELNGRIPLEMIAIPGGSFLMGSRAGIGFEDEYPQHSVRIPSFYAGKYPVTQEQWAAVMDRVPPYRCQGAKLPVDRVSWDEAQAFCQQLSEKTGRSYRLLSEAEWEYACRAGTTTPFYCGETITTDLANYVGEHLYHSEPKGIYRHVTTEVGSFPPNAFGLYDMSGNVWEWCADAWYDNYVGAPVDGRTWAGDAGSRRVLRGGCWHDTPGLCRSASRLKHVPHEGEDYFGFRVALTSLEQNFTGVAQHNHPHANQGRRIARRIQTWFRR